MQVIKKSPAFFLKNYLFFKKIRRIFAIQRTTNTADGPKAANMKNFINTYDQVKNAIESGKAGNIFNLIDGSYVGMGEFEYFDTAEVIFDLVKSNSEGFVIDICERILDSIKNGRPIIITDKQRWCVAFAALKISISCVDALREADQAFVAEVEAEEAAENDEVETNEEPAESTYCVQHTMIANSSLILEASDEGAAKAEFAKQRDQLASNTPADVSGWTDEDQAWRDVYRVELLRIDFDESGDVADMMTIDATPYYFN